MTIKNENEELVQVLIDGNYLKTQFIIDAFRAIDRKDFVPDALRSQAYENIPLPIGGGQTISQPLVVALMFELLQPRPGDSILDVGAGSGWTTTLLAYIVSQAQTDVGHVVAIERISEIAEFGKHNIAKYNFIKRGVVEFVCSDGSKGAPDDLLPKEGFNGILAGAAALDEVPTIWKEQLSVGGKIVAPVGSRIVYIHRISENEFRQKELFGFSFVPLIE